MQISFYLIKTKRLFIFISLLVLKAFKEHIHTKHLFEEKDHLLLALSGGVDSVVLAHLLKASGFQFSLAHCNFKLRGKDSDADEIFCRKLAKALDVTLHVTHFDVKAYCKSNQVSVQVAARELRYAWFSQLLKEKKLAYLLTAHHAGDSIETLFINLLRGTGINGLKGIPEKAGQLVRPLLPFSKTAILDYAIKNNIAYREDKSNSEHKYERNFLRLNIIPALKKQHPNFETTLLSNISNFKEEAEIVNAVLKKKAKQVLTKKKGFIYLNRKLLLKESYFKTLLHFLLAPFGFNSSQLADIEKNLSKNGLVGKTFSSPTHMLTIDRQQLVIRELTAGNFEALEISSLEDLKKTALLEFKEMDKFELPAKNELIVKGEQLIFPITIRGKNKGDRFMPFGMKGFKLLSDFLKDQKLNNFEKENCKLLVNGNGDIIWVMGYRSDERYKVNSKNTDLVKLTLIE